MALKAVQYAPKYCEEAKADYEKSGPHPLSRFDTSHDLSVIDSSGKRHYVGHFKHADWAAHIGKLIEQHGLPWLDSEEAGRSPEQPDAKV